MKIEGMPSRIDATTKLICDNCRKFLIFFVINFPVPKKSARAISFLDDVKVLINYKIIEKASNVDDVLVGNNLDPFPSKAEFKERTVITRSQSTIVLSFIGHIRNSIAHGRFNVIRNGKEDVFCFGRHEQE